jgi:hypothetical protein
MTIPFWLQEHCARLSLSDEALTNLNLNIRKLDTTMMQSLANALQTNQTLRVLNLTSSVAQNPSSILALEPILRNHPSLQILHLSYNRLSIHEVQIFGPILQTNHILTELHLDYNLIDLHLSTEDRFSTTTQIADGLRHNRSLRILQVNYNHITDSGCIRLAQALDENHTLQILGLKRNQITETGARAFLETLQYRNFKLERIDLSQNPVSRLDPDSNRESVSSSLILLSQMDLLCRANAAGRRWLQDSSANVPESIWPFLLSRVRHDLPLVYFFLGIIQPKLYKNNEEKY